MTKYPTQAQCKEAWHKMLKDWGSLDRIEKLDGISRIDQMTPWSETEPDWWLEMMAVQKELQNQAP